MSTWFFSMDYIRALQWHGVLLHLYFFDYFHTIYPMIKIDGGCWFMDYEYTVKFHFNENREEEYKIKTNIGQETFTEEVFNGFNEKPWYTFTETEHFKSILINTKDVYKVSIVQQTIQFD